MSEDHSGLPLWEAAICGVTAGGLAQWYLALFLLFPFIKYAISYKKQINCEILLNRMASPADLIKVQVQMEGRRRLMGLKPRVNGAADALKKILYRGGVKALWKGSIPNVYRAALVNLGDLTTYDFAKRNIMSKTKLPDCHTVHIMASICAGLVAAGLGTPADVVKTRIMNQPTDANGRYVAIYFSNEIM